MLEASHGRDFITSWFDITLTHYIRLVCVFLFLFFHIQLIVWKQRDLNSPNFFHRFIQILLSFSFLISFLPFFSSGLSVTRAVSSPFLVSQGSCESDAGSFVCCWFSSFFLPLKLFVCTRTCHYLCRTERPSPEEENKHTHTHTVQ